MMREFLVAILCICFTISITANEVDENKFTGSLLWKVSGNGLSKPSYILGTHHFADVSFLDEIDGFEEAMENAKVVIGELDMANKAELGQKVQGYMMLAEGEKGYKDFLSAEDYQQLSDDMVTHLGMPLTPFEGAKPTLISLMLAVKLFTEAKPGFNPQTHVSIDEHVQLVGRACGKEIKGLEDVEDQINALFSDSFEEQLQELQCSLREVNIGKESTVKLWEFYKQADLNGLYALAFDDNPDSACPITKDKKHSILDNRNDKWLEKLPTLMKEESNLIVVGALHLAGKEGLLYQLHQMGYEVEAIKQEAQH